VVRSLKPCVGLGCKSEVTAEDPKGIDPFAETDPNAPRDTPPLTIASLSIRTIVNCHENIREIVCATARIYGQMVSRI
jgi:DNA polymerase alpha subunit A